MTNEGSRLGMVLANTGFKTIGEYYSETNIYERIAIERSIAEYIKETGGLI